MKPRDLILFIPFLIFSILIITEDFSGYKLKLLLAENFIFSFFIFGVCRFFKYKIIFTLGYIFLAFKSFFHVFYIKKYGEIPGASIVYVTIETNFQETREFIETAFGWEQLLLILFFILPLILLKKYPERLKRRNLWPAFMASLLIIFFYIPRDLFRFNLYGTAISGIIEYQNFRQTLNNHRLSRKIGNAPFVIRKDNPKKPEIHVLVIGESTTRHRMGLYGYARNNNPLLKSINDELYINENAISAHTYTIESLSQALTLTKKGTHDRYSIIQLLNAAGFDTYWISNQQPVGVFDSFITTIATAANNQKFLNISDFHARTPYDGKLIPEFKEVLRNAKQDTFVVIHLMGTHSSYNKRYPPNFNAFDEKPHLIISESKSAFDLVNEYDNAILYNDYVIYKFIEALKEVEPNSYLLFIADHGEDVFQVNNSASHSVGEGTKPMYDIPFVLWTSKDYLQDKDFIFDTQRPIYLNDLGYILSDLSGLEHTEFKQEKSVFNKKYEVPNRLIFDNHNYDSIFLSK